MKEDLLNALIASRISSYLSDQGKTQADLAKYMGVSQASVSNWCKGVKMPRMDKIDKICAFLNCRRSDLMCDTPAQESAPALPLTDRENHLIGIYRQLDERGKVTVDKAAETALEQVGDTETRPGRMIA